MNRTLALTLALFLALAGTGCIQNMSDLKDRVGGSEEDVTSAALESPESPAANATVTANATKKAPPVARISVFGANGAMLFKSTFTAESPDALIFIEEKTKVSLIAGDSEAVERGATLTGFSWTLNGKPLEGARQASFETGDPGVYAVGLTVTDSNGKTDDQTVKIGVAPKPYEVVTELVAMGPLVGVEGNGEAVDLPFELASPEKPATVTGIVIVAVPPLQCDAAIEFLAADGTSLGSADNVGMDNLDQTETIEIGATAFGAYTIRVAPYTCAADEVPVTVTVTYLPVVEGIGADDHGGHAGH